MATLALAATVVGAGASAYGAYQQGQAQSEAAQYQAAVARNNQTIANQNAQYAVQEGQAMEQAKREQTAQMIGTQRAQAGALGLDPNSGSALRLQKDTSRLGETDALTIRNNAARASYGYTTQGINFSNQGQLDMMTAKNAAAGGQLGAFSSLIGGASSVSDKWLRYKQAGIYD